MREVNHGLNCEISIEEEEERGGEKGKKKERKEREVATASSH